ncbi:MAG: C40 family peptidase [Defluviitaleaceae bacterium]|nr:C40 family peptidase [Defluviitaleaceae bacterium]
MYRSCIKIVVGLSIVLAVLAVVGFAVKGSALSIAVAVVTEENVSAHEAADENSPALVVLDEGEVVDILFYEGGWVAFNRDGVRMYARLSSLAVLQVSGLITSNDTLILYEPTPLSDVMMTLHLGTVVDVIGFFGDYFAVSIGANSAYIHGSNIIGTLLGHLQEYGPIPFYFSARRGSIDTMPSLDRYLLVVGSLNGLNMRTRPNTNSQVLVSIPNGNRLEIISMGREWHRVRYLGEEGYVNTRFTELHVNGALETQSFNLIDQLIANAKLYIGVRYTWGGTSAATGFDCSGFTLTVFRSVGINLNRVSRDQARNGTPVARADIQRGDLLFFATGNNRNTITHVGIYIGDGQFIHSASGNRRGVVITNLSYNYWQRTYHSAVRVIE